MSRQVRYANEIGNIKSVSALFHDEDVYVSRRLMVERDDMRPKSPLECISNHPIICSNDSYFQQKGNPNNEKS